MTAYELGVKSAREDDALEQLFEGKDNPRLRAAVYRHPHVLNMLTALLTAPLAVTPGGQYTHPAAAIGSAAIAHSIPRDEVDAKLKQHGIKHDYALRHPYLHAVGSQLAGAATGAGIGAGLGGLAGGPDGALRAAPAGAAIGGIAGSIASVMRHYGARKRLLERLIDRKVGRQQAGL